MTTLDNKTGQAAPAESEIRTLSLTEIDDVAGAGWLRDAWNWIKDHVRPGPGTVGVSVKGKF